MKTEVLAPKKGSKEEMKKLGGLQSKLEYNVKRCFCGSVEKEVNYGKKV